MKRESDSTTGYKGLIREGYVFGMACFASIGGLLFGYTATTTHRHPQANNPSYDQGVISGVLVMTNFGKHFPTLASDPTLQGWMVSVLTLGAMVGALLNGPIADRLSRRWSLLAANVIFLCGSAVQCAARTTAHIFVGRAVAGVAVGMLSMGVPLYLGELAPPNIRGALVALQQLAITVGIMVAFWLDYGTQHIGGTGEGQSEVAWRLPLALQCVPAAVMAVGTWFLPYSPRWLVSQGMRVRGAGVWRVVGLMGAVDREDEALVTLCRLRRTTPADPRIRFEMMEIKVATAFDRESLAVRFPGVTSKFVLAVRQYQELFVVRHLSKRLMIACLLQIIQQFTGISKRTPYQQLKPALILKDAII
ncbi:hypothetical protein SLS56_010364 [Neofusicoccum ribis]|uniref:Major facilitator superfamily (MFS) profile domain-containing protein n=1 Tax=Neofusicoccum ribis TaxID=45134 RepID=A0ABR3SFF5_9PEZI